MKCDPAQDNHFGLPSYSKWSDRFGSIFKVILNPASQKILYCCRVYSAAGCRLGHHWRRVLAAATDAVTRARFEGERPEQVENQWTDEPGLESTL
jgi:hypothetical protein